MTDLREAGVAPTVEASRSGRNPLLALRGLSVDVTTESGDATVVSEVSFGIPRGGAVGLVGESGSGKTMTVLSILRLMEPVGKITSGVIEFNGADLLAMSNKELNRIRGVDIGMIYQDPMSSLNPALTVGDQIEETLMEHRSIGRRVAKKRARALLDLVGIPDAQRRLRDYPHSLSGGMRQRVMIAIALSCEPQLLIADEPTTALDVTVQARILELLRTLQQELGMALLLVSHDIGVVSEICDTTLIMYAGEIVETGSTGDLLACPKHPYTAALWHAMPHVSSPGGPLLSIPGVIPEPGAMPAGCRFHPRCDYVCAPDCTTSAIELRTKGNRQVRCARAEELSLEGIASQ